MNDYSYFSSVTFSYVKSTELAYVRTEKKLPQIDYVVQGLIEIATI